MISIVIPTYKRNEQLAECLSLLAPEVQQVAPETYEVLVADDAPDGQARQLINDRFPWVQWIKGPGRGPAANRNHGARHAKGDWLLFTDDDCLPDRGWLRSYQQAIAAGDSAVQVYEGKTVADRPQRRYDEESPVNEKGGNLWSCNFAVSRLFFEQLNGFDERFSFAMEDVDFHLRASQQTKIIFLGEALVVHPWRRIRLRGWFTTQVSARVIFFRKHRELLGWRYRMLLAKSFVATVLKGGVMLFRFSFRGWKAYIVHCVWRFCLIFAW